MDLNRRSPYEISEELFKTRYQGAELVFVAGSFRRKEDTATSDIDLVVVYPKIPQAYRESFVYQGWPVEAFVHDPETLNYFFWEVDAKDGIPSLPMMVVESSAIPGDHPLVYRLKSLADHVLDQGPPLLSSDQITNLRYVIGDLLDDLKGPRTPYEAQSLIAKLHETLADFWFRAQGRWSASGKHIPRRMNKLNPDFADEWVKVFACGFQGNTTPVIALTEKVLAMYGGYVFDGYSRRAPGDWRKALPMITTDFSLSQKESGLLPQEQILIHETLGQIEVRLVRSEDIPRLRVLLNSAYKKLSDMGLNFSATFQDDESVGAGLHEGRTIVLIRKDHEIIGTMKIRNHNAIDARPALYLSRFAVRPDLQGAGLGLHLLQLAETIALREKCECLQLDTAQPAEHLIKFYTKYGFKIVRPIYYEGKTYTSWILQKKL